MNITLTLGEAQLLANVIDREAKLNGIQAVAEYGMIARQLIEGAKAEQQEQEAEDGNAESNT